MWRRPPATCTCSASCSREIFTQKKPFDANGDRDTVLARTLEGETVPIAGLDARSHGAHRASEGFSAVAAAAGRRSRGACALD